MNEKQKTGLIVILASVGGILLALFLAIFTLPFVLMMIVWGGDGKWDDEEKITAVVTENQETLDNIVSKLLEPKQDLDFVIDIEEKEFQSLGNSGETEETLYDLEDIYRLAEELKILKIYAYKDSDVGMVIFRTYSSGMAGSSQEKGFFYLEGGLPEKIFEYNLISIYRNYNYSAVVDNWYYYDLSY